MSNADQEREERARAAIARSRAARVSNAASPEDIELYAIENRRSAAKAPSGSSTSSTSRATATSDSGETFSQAYARNRSAWLKGKGGPTFSFNGKPYSVDTKEEAAANKAMRESPTRGRGTNRAEAPASGESQRGFGSKITNRPKEGAKSIYADLDAGKVAGAAATIATAVPAGRAVKGAVDAARAVGARAAAKKAGSEIVRDADRVNFANGGLVRRASVKSHGKAC